MHPVPRVGTWLKRLSAPVLFIAGRDLADVAAKAAEIVPGRGTTPPKRPPTAPLLLDRPQANAAPQLAALDDICADAKRALEAAGFSRVDYVAVREAETLKVVSTHSDKPLRVLAAAWLGQTRLIDNVPG